MALLTKAQVRSAVAQAIDDPGNKRWSQTNLDVLISMAQDTMFQTINDTFDFFLSNGEALATDANGIIALSSLAKRFYRMQQVKVVSSGLELQPKLFSESVPQASYYLLGNNVVTDPVVVSSSLRLTYSYLPVKFFDLATDTTVLADFPEGHEAALIYYSAAWAMTKGDAENMAQIARIADSSIEALLSHIARRYPIGTNARVQQVKMALMRNPLLGVAAQAQG
jgi:hypothetical protein